MGNSVVIDFIGKDRATKIARKLKGAMGKVETSFDSAGRALKKFNKKQDASIKKMNAFSKLKVAAGIAAGVALARKGLTTAAIQETAILKVLSNIETAEQKVALRPAIKKALEEAGRLGIPMEEAGAGLFTMTSQLGASMETLDKFRGSMKLAVGGFAPLQSSISVTNKLMEVFTDLEGDSDKTAQQIFQAQVIGDTDVTQLANALPQAAGAAAAAGLESAEFLSIIAATTKRLKNTNQSATALRALIAQFGNALPGTDRAEALAEAGLAGSTVELREAGLIDQLGKIAALRATDAGQLLLDRAFTGEEAKQLINTLDKTQVERIEAGVGQIESGAALELSFRDVTKSLAVTMAKNGTLVDRLTATIGKKLAPGLERVATAFELAEKRNDEAGGGLLGLFARAATVSKGDALAEIARKDAASEARIAGASGADAMKVEVVVSTDGDLKAAVAVSSSGGLDTAVQNRGS